MPIAAGTNPALPWRAFYDAVDAMDPEATLALIHPEASFQVANWEPVVGLENLRPFIGSAWKQWKLLKHNFTNVWEVGDTTIVELTVDHILGNDEFVTTPCAVIQEWKDGLLYRHRAYEDPRPLGM